MDLEPDTKPTDIPSEPIEKELEVRLINIHAKLSRQHINQ